MLLPQCHLEGIKRRLILSKTRQSVTNADKSHLGPLPGGVSSWEASKCSLVSTGVQPEQVLCHRVKE